MPVPDHVVEIQRHPETIVEGKRLGLHFEKDSRSKNYPVAQWIQDHGGTYQSDPTKLTSKQWPRDIPILDQGSLGSCTGNAGVGMIGSGKIFGADQERFKDLVENENLATNVYGRATRLDGLGQPYYPPEDRGSTSLGVLKALREMGFIDEYRWGFGLVDALNTIAGVGAGITGVLWYEGFDSPRPDGEMVLEGNVRGGHEMVIREIDVENRRVWPDNSWGEGFGIDGRAYWTWSTFDQLLQQQGDFAVGVW